MHYCYDVKIKQRNYVSQQSIDKRVKYMYELSFKSQVQTKLC